METVHDYTQMKTIVLNEHEESNDQLFGYTGNKPIIAIDAAYRNLSYVLLSISIG